MILYHIVQNCIKCQMEQVHPTWLYGNLAKLSEKIRKRKLMFDSHSKRTENVMASKVVLWTSVMDKGNTLMERSIYV